MLTKLLFKRNFSTFKGQIPIVETANFLRNGPNTLSDCKKLAAALEETSCVLIRDPRINQGHVDNFIDLMEKFFESRAQRYYNGEKNLDDFYPEYNYQTGALPDQLLVMRDLKYVADSYSKENKPITTFPPKADCKWRLLWRVGERSQDPKHFMVDPPVHVPQDFPEWKATMDSVGQLLLDGVSTVSEMMALGLGYERQLFSKMLKGAPQELAPSASDLTRYEPGTPLSAFHYDLNFLTIHGRNRYPGLFIWLRTGERIKVSIPEGHLLVQVGKQLEMLTGGHLHAGYHEVVCLEEARKKAEEAKVQGRSPWRINTTLFSCVHPDVILTPFDRFATKEAKKEYPPIRAQEQMEEEFKAIGMVSEKAV